MSTVKRWTVYDIKVLLDQKDQTASGEIMRPHSSRRSEIEVQDLISNKCHRKDTDKWRVTLKG